MTVREELRLRVFQERFPWKILGPKRKAVIGDRGKLLSQEFHDLYSSPCAYIQGYTNLGHHVARTL